MYVENSSPLFQMYGCNTERYKDLIQELVECRRCSKIVWIVFIIVAISFSFMIVYNQFEGWKWDIMTCRDLHKWKGISTYGMQSESDSLKSNSNQNHQPSPKLFNSLQKRFWNPFKICSIFWYKISFNFENCVLQKSMSLFSY